MPPLRGIAPDLIAAWKTGEYDTKDLAIRYGLKEAKVYRMVYGLDKVEAVAKVPEVKAPTPRKPKPVLVKERKEPVEQRPQYRLLGSAGYLNKTLDGVAVGVENAYTGNAEECLEVCANNPLASKMLMEVVE